MNPSTTNHETARMLRMNEYFGIGDQEVRRVHVIRLLEMYTRPYFDEQGTWNGPGGSLGTRERLWFALAYLAGGSEESIRMANRIIETTNYRFCHFAPMTVVQLLLRNEAKLLPTAREALRRYLNQTIDSFMRDDMDFVGVNDNFPCMSTFITLIGGQLLHRKDLIDVGSKRLLQLKSLLTHQGFVSEFNSPTYSGVQLCAIAEIANGAEDAELRRVALQCEERLWTDMLAHLHLPTSQVAGPYSRAYTVDSAGHTHQSRFVLYALLGDRLSVNPLNTLFSSREGLEGEIIHHHVPFMQVSAAWLMMTVYHCPAFLVRHALERSYPYEVAGTAEGSSSTDAPGGGQQDGSPDSDLVEYPAGEGVVTTFITEDYAMGSTTREFHNGVQTDSFHLLYRRSQQVTHQRDVRTVYARYLINDKRPGQTNVYPHFGATADDSHLWDEGRKIGIQDRYTAMMLYKPKRFGRHRVTSLALSLIFPCHYGDVEEIWFGRTRVEGTAGASKEPCPVFVKDGPMYMCFHPLLLTDAGRHAAVRTEMWNGYRIISFYNYEGAETDFSGSAFDRIGNGFVAEIRSKSEAESFEKFREAMGTAKITDESFACGHTRHSVLRRTSYARNGLSMACEYSPGSEGIKRISVNGLPLDRESLRITGLDVTRLPFMQRN